MNNSASKATRNAGIVVKSTGSNVADAVLAITGIGAGKRATPASIARGIGYVFGVSNDVEADRVRIVQAFNADGIKGGRGMAAAAAKANGGVTVRGFSKSTAARYQTLADVITRDDLPTLSDAQTVAAIGALATLSNYGAGADVLTASIDLAIKAGKAAAFVKSLSADAKAYGQGDFKALTAPASGKRPVKGTADVTGKGDAAADADTSEPAPKANTRAAVEALSGATVLSLIAELQRRVGGKGFTPDAVAQDAFDLLAAEWEARVAVLTEQA